MSGRLEAARCSEAAAAMLVLGVGLAGPESEPADGAAGGLAAGRAALVGVVVLVVAGSGGVEDLDLSPAEGDAALTSSTGLFCQKKKHLCSSPTGIK